MWSIAPLILTVLLSHACADGSSLTLDVRHFGDTLETDPVEANDGDTTPVPPDEDAADSGEETRPLETNDAEDDATQAPDADDATQAADAAPEPWTPPEDPFDWTVLPVALDLPPLSQALLEASEVATVRATVQLADGPAIPVLVTLTGRYDANGAGFLGKPGLALRFGDGQDDLEVEHHGTTGLVLGPMNEDPSQMRERLVHILHRLADVPAPRATHARLSIAGEDFGLYVMTEPLTNPGFLEAATGERHGGLFVSRERTDLWPWQVADYLQLAGDGTDRDGLTALATALETFRLARLAGNPVPLEEAVGSYVDLGRFVDQVALHIWVGHWAGYARSASGFGLHVAPAVDGPRRVSFVPMTLGRSLAVDDAPNPWVGGGKLVGQCRVDHVCRGQLGAALRRVIEVTRAANVDEVASSLRFAIEDEVRDDPRRAIPLGEVRTAQDELLWVLSGRTGWVEANLGCAEPSQVDNDGDGFSPCIDDCDDDRADVHPGAVEQCNLRDDDCNGILDDSEACEPCVEAPSPREGVQWFLCYWPRNWVDARAQCQEMGGDLASLASEAEHLAFMRATLGLQSTSWWLGLSDRETEGTFVWADGEPLTFTRWAEGEPNDTNGREDCAQLVPWSGRWNDLDCARLLPFVCQR